MTKEQQQREKAQLKQLNNAGRGGGDGERGTHTRTVVASLAEEKDAQCGAGAGSAPHRGTPSTVASSKWMCSQSVSASVMSSMSRASGCRVTSLRLYYCTIYTI